MAKLKTRSPFELDVDEIIYKGELKDLKKSERKEYEKATDAMRDEDDAVEKAYKLALETRVISDQKDDILQVGEDYGYELVFKTILLDIAESLKKNENDS